MATKSASQLIDARIKELGDWHARPPAFADKGGRPRGRRGMEFAKDASLKDPSGVFNSSLTGNTRRAIGAHSRRREAERS